MRLITGGGGGAWALAACVSVLPVLGAAQSRDGGDAGAFVALMQVRRQLTLPGWTAPIAAPELRYRIERTRTTGGRWRTVTTIVAPGTKAGGDVPLGRVEDDEDGSVPRTFGADGVLVRLPAPARDGEPRRLLTGTAPAAFDGPAGEPALARGAGVVFRSAAASTRREALRARFGAPAARTGEFDRYVTRDGDEETEVLVDRWQLPSEVTVRRAGEIVTRTIHTYADGVGATRTLRAIRAESREAHGVRSMVEVDVTTLQLEQED